MITKDELKSLLADQRVVYGLAALISAPLVYKFYRRLGAPRWAALAITDNQLRLQMLKMQLEASPRPIRSYDWHGICPIHGLASGFYIPPDYGVSWCSGCGHRLSLPTSRYAT